MIPNQAGITTMCNYCGNGWGRGYIMQMSLIWGQWFLMHINFSQMSSDWSKTHEEQIRNTHSNGKQSNHTHLLRGVSGIHNWSIPAFCNSPAQMTLNFFYRKLAHNKQNNVIKSVFITKQTYRSTPTDTHGLVSARAQTEEMSFRSCFNVDLRFLT